MRGLRLEIPIVVLIRFITTQTPNHSVGIKPLSEFCTRQKGVIGELLDLMEASPGDATILRSWVAH